MATQYFSDPLAHIPTLNILSYGGSPVLNVQRNQLGTIFGKDDKERPFNRITKKGFAVPGKKASGAFDKPEQPIAQGFQIRKEQYVSKVARDAVTAYQAIQQSKANQMYFDELDRNNIFPRRGRPVTLTGNLATQTDSSGNTTMYTQPGWIRTQQNQLLGDVAGPLQRSMDPSYPTQGNAAPATRVMGSNKVMTKTDDAETMTTETGALGSVNKILMSAGVQTTRVEDHRVRDLRTQDTQTFNPDIDKKTLDLIYSHPGKFQTFLDGLTFANNTLQQQLQSQSNQLGDMASTTMQTFRQILKSVGFEESTLPATISPDDMLNVLKNVEKLTPVGLVEVAQMRTLIENLRSQRVAEVSDIGVQYEAPVFPHLRVHTSNLPTTMFSSSTSPIGGSPTGSIVSYQSLSPTATSPRRSPSMQPGPSEDDIFPNTENTDYVYPDKKKHETHAKKDVKGKKRRNDLNLDPVDDPGKRTRKKPDRYGFG